MEISKFRDPTKLYGPGIQVVNRRRRQGIAKAGPGRVEDGRTTLQAIGSRFVVLDEDITVEEVGIISVAEGLPASSEVIRSGTNEPGVKSGVDSLTPNHVSWLREPMLHEKEVLGKVISAKTSLPSDKHSTVQVVGSRVSNGKKLGKGRVLPSLIVDLTPREGSKHRCVNDDCPCQVMVVDMVTDEDQWNWSYLQELFPTEILDNIATVPPPMAHYGTDTTGGDGVIRGNLVVPQCVRVFMWLTTHRRHLKNVERVRRHLAFSDELIKPEVLSQFYALPFEDWLHVNLHGFGIMAGISVDWNRDSVLPKGQRLIIECEEVFTSSRATLNHVVHDNTFWEGPERGWIKENVDAAVNPREESCCGQADRIGMFTINGKEGLSIPPSTMAVLAAEDKRRWEDHARDANVVNQCSRRVDPGR
ncbi:hypothetical protein V6N12_047253 [Hibiscus sabdariffa]|uniref:Uncharacterized protein n=1 Tax=Hibiscus sabdariffa TaxID=183260 RepID=A0ABR2DAC2_9ROSI